MSHHRLFPVYVKTPRFHHPLTGLQAAIRVLLQSTACHLSGAVLPPVLTCSLALMHYWFGRVGTTATSISLASMTSHREMLLAAVLMTVVVTSSRCISQAQAADGLTGWGQAHATFYGGPDGQGTMGEL